MKILITGFPGTGKSSVARELQKRGYAAYDPEAMRGYMHLQDVHTGRRIHLPENAGRGWFDEVGQANWDIGRVAQLLDEHETVFICSLADNMEALYDAFDKIFVLVLDEIEYSQRIQGRQKAIDSNPAMVADTLTLHEHFEQGLIQRGAIAITTHPDVQAIVEKILKLTHA